MNQGCMNAVTCGRTAAGAVLLGVAVSAMGASMPFFSSGLYFEPCPDVAGNPTRFVSRGLGHATWVESGGVTVKLLLSSRHGIAPGGDPSVSARPSPYPSLPATEEVCLRFLGVNPEVSGVGEEPLPGRSHYFTGSDPASWRTGVHHYRRVRYAEVYPGIDLVYRGNEGCLEYDFTVQPGGDPGRIECEVADRQGRLRTTRLTDQGELVVVLEGGEVRLLRPYVFQERDGHRLEVASRFVQGRDGRIRFALASHDPARPLVIDPVLSYSTYLGGFFGEEGLAVATDEQGMVYVTGQSISADFPMQGATNGNMDVFVAKFDPSQSNAMSLVYAVTVGGSGEERGRGISVDGFGRAYVAGNTRSDNFPTVAAFQAVNNGGQNSEDAFIFALDATGSSLIYSTYFGGSQNDAALDIAVNGSGNAAVGGLTFSHNPASVSTPVPFPITPGAYYLTNTAGGKGWVATFSPGGVRQFATFLSEFDEGSSVVSVGLDPADNVYVAGTGTFPVTPGALKLVNQVDAAVASLDPTLSSVRYGTFLGGTGQEVVNALAVDAAGKAHVTGWTVSANFPTTANAFQDTPGGGTGGFARDAYLSVLSADGSFLEYSTLLAGNSTDEGYDVAVGAAGQIYVTGETYSTNFPTVNAVQEAHGGGLRDVFASILMPNGSVLLSTYLGSSRNDAGRGITFDHEGRALVTGWTQSTNFPVSAGAFQPSLGGFPFGANSDAFLARLELGAVALPIQAVFHEQPGLTGPGEFALVAGKDLVIRTYLQSFGTQQAAAEALVCVDGDLESCAPDRSFSAMGTVFPVSHDFSVAERRAGTNSLNVFIRGEDADRVLTPGRHTFSVRVRPVASGAFPEARLSFEGLFRESERINVFLEPLIFGDLQGNLFGPEDGDGQLPLDMADAELLNQSVNLVRNIYPLNEEAVTLVMLPPFLAGPNLGPNHVLSSVIVRSRQREFQRRTLLNDARISNTYIQAAPANNIYMAAANNVVGPNQAPLGIIPGTTASILGFRAVKLDEPKAIISLDRLPSNDASVTMASRISLHATVAHEVGHVFGLGEEYSTPKNNQPQNPPHPAARDANGTAAGYYILEEDMAFDVNGLRSRIEAVDLGQPPPADPPGRPVFVVVDDTMVPPVPDADPIAMGAVYNFMGGTGRSAVPAGLGMLLEGGPAVRTWTRRLNYEFLYPILTKPLPAPPGGGSGGSGPREVIHLSGDIGMDGQVQFDPILIATTDLSFTRPTGTVYAVEFRDGTGALLDEVRFDLDFELDGTLDGVVPVAQEPVSFILDLPPGTESVHLIKEEVELEVFARTPSSPMVQIDSIQLTGLELTAAWSAMDPDGDPLVYNVTYAPGGTNRYILALDLTGTGLTVGLGGLPAPQAGSLLEVEARDGFNRAVASAPIPLEGVGPVITFQSANGQFLLQWPSAGSETFNFVTTTNLNPPRVWVPASQTIMDDGTNKTVIIMPNPGEPVRFFQLRQTE